MQSDQKIGVCLLIALTGFGLALGFGRRESPAEVAVRGAALTPAAEVVDLQPVASVQATEARPRDVSDVTLPPPPERSPRPRVEESPADQAARPVTTSLPPPGVAEDASPLPAVRSYIVRPGDTLTAIASRELGDMMRYGEIFEANREALGHPDALRVGQTIVLPVR